MQFEEIDAGELPHLRRGLGAVAQLRFSAAVVVVRQRAQGDREEVFRDEDLGGGYSFPTAAEALRFAVQRGHDVVMCRTGIVSRPAPLAA